MKRTLWIKAVLTGAMAIGLLIPIAMIRSLVSERQNRRDEVVAGIASSSYGSQKIVGPLLVVKWKRTTWKRVVDEATNKARIEETTEEGSDRYVPETLDVKADADTSMLERGIYQVLVYRTKARLKGHFEVAPSGCQPEEGVRCEFEAPVLVVGISDPRGLDEKAVIKWNGQEAAVLPGATTTQLNEGIHAVVEVDLARAQPYTFDLEIGLRGMRSFEIVPIGKSSTIAMTSPWPHPSFIGQYLPIDRVIGGQGFEAKWQTSHLATNVETAANECVTSNCASLLYRTVGVSFVDPVDLYLKTDRALKYGFLYVSITFLLFFLFEVLKRLAIHPVQYGLVGVALAMFFLLVLALAEHIAFGWAYLIAAVSCVVLIGYYVRYLLLSFGRSIGFVSMLGAAYGMLYVLLVLEDHALMLGSVLLFALLAAVMVLTRHVNWHRMGDDLLPSSPSV